MRKGACLILFLVFCIIQAPSPAEAKEGEWDRYRICRAKVAEVFRSGKTSGEGDMLLVKVLGGQGATLYLPYPTGGHDGYNLELRPGDEIFVALSVDQGEIQGAYYLEFGRDKKLGYLLVLFLGLLVVLGAKRA